jgi:hypothetical protein
MCDVRVNFSIDVGCVSLSRETCIRPCALVLLRRKRVRDAVVDGANYLRAMHERLEKTTRGDASRPGLLHARTSE